MFWPYFCGSCPCSSLSHRPLAEIVSKGSSCVYGGQRMLRGVHLSLRLSLACLSVGANPWCGAM